MAEAPLRKMVCFRVPVDIWRRLRAHSARLKRPMSRLCLAELEGFLEGLPGEGGPMDQGSRVRGQG